MGFDCLVMRNHGIDFEGVALDDTLLAHHTFASHLPQRLDHVVSEYCDSAPWKIQFGRRGAEEKGLPPEKLSPDELTKYNAADCRLTAKVWQRMQEDLDTERSVYEHDKQLARVCHEMAYAGIGIDAQRKEELSTLLQVRRDSLCSDMRSIIREPDFAPGRLEEVRRVLFKKLGGKSLRRTSAGALSTNNETLEHLRGDDTELGRFAGALLQWRLVGKIRSTYVDAVEVNPRTGRAHYNWKPFGTVSGRLACRLQSCPRWDGRHAEGRPREIYVPRRGNVFVYYDVSQAEMRIAAYIAADSTFMAATNGDVHSNNARAVFPEAAEKGYFTKEAVKDPARGKPYRDIAKNLGFAIAYGAEAEKVFVTLRSKGFPVTMRQVELILSRLRAAYRVYYKFVSDNVDFVREHGYLRSPVVGRIRWLGWYPKPTEVSNYPVQSALADIVNQRMISLLSRLPVGCVQSCNVHDAVIYDCPKSESSALIDMIQAEWDKTIPLKGGDLRLPIDLKVGERWSEL